MQEPRSDQLPAHGRKHLVVQLARFGDLVQTKRLLATLAARPEAEVHLAVDRSLAGLAELLFPGVRVHALAAHAQGQADPGQALAENMPAFAALRGAGFHEVYNLNYSGLNFALSTLFDPAIVRGHRMENGQRLSGPWARMALRWTRQRRFAGLNLVDYWAELADDPLPPGMVNPVARRGGGGVGLVLAGRNARRSLPPRTLALLAGAVVQGTGASRVVLLGSRAERAAAKELLALMPRALRDMTRDMVGATDWRGLLDALDGLDALLTPDTGTMHLAAHLGVPVHAFFLSSAWCFETGPYGLGHRVWQADMDCAPCLETSPCPIGTRCARAFSGRDLLRHLAGNPAFETPEGLTGYVSAFDPLGLTFRAVLGPDPEAERRRQFRTLMAGVLGRPMPGVVDPELAREFLPEEDWMLPGAAKPHTTMEFLGFQEKVQA